ncbi:16S rRNA (guanine(527)-N(7))-methyltransferase RsmG [Solemya pervernicosa gill symbiont]|uniref:Ribosomal RNA small subunit methyltransferase G n=2 Tax=Gammaproteobacteria incertae sedis TaxID=118884 RepID=A0A1T2L2P5_9GAMM|nr:16S rRNA (guanine(527)-N(7))-methyltransferase RsmG [Candidatus Reidiella endopervernicosa]OOZ39388.1 16S rRNA (guanine(527)-N(7))-methyltransferase RsmG [Solemya pervernicosa gill symbiont]QKQ25332.1 16S rRNA (guanine(527)-N(7))-methyltransferase RsmG [Candidatus Reidiella endopervernicosa]
MHGNEAAPEELFEQGLAALHLDLSAEVQQKFMDYIALMLKWNRVYNLTSVRKPALMVTRHLLDSLVVLQHIKEPRLLDVGSGAGLPGIPLALARPDWQIVLLDGNAKKTRFMTQAVADLGLQNVKVVHERVELFKPEQPFDTIISRAFSTVENMTEMAGGLLAPEGRLLAMKGVYPLAELEMLPDGFTVKEVIKLDVPTLDADRHLVWIERV